MSQKKHKRYRKAVRQLSSSGEMTLAKMLRVPGRHRRRHFLRAVAREGELTHFRRDIMRPGKKGGQYREGRELFLTEAARERLEAADGEMETDLHANIALMGLGKLSQDSDESVSE